MPDRPIAISVSGVNKDFRLASEQRQTLKERVVNPRFDRNAKLFHALSDIDFQVERGEFFGIVGRNGSGKSTLLKCMAGIYRLDSGSIKIGGRLSTFIELGVGFNPDLAAKDNIILNGIMLGLSPKEAAARVDEVIAFAELQDHVDLKLKNYSSGMQVRLAFSVMTQIDADVLLIDEVLAVGDASFQAKCFDVFRQLRAQGKTIVLVTHDMATVARFCDRAMLIEDGRIVKQGDPEMIGDQYLSLNFSDTSGGPAADLEALSELGTDTTELVNNDRLPTVEAVGAFVFDGASQPIKQVRAGDPVLIAADVVAHRDLDHLEMVLELRDEQDVVVYGASTANLAETPPPLKRGDRWRLTTWIEMRLRPGHLRARVITRDAATREVFHRSGDFLTFEVTSTHPAIGVADLQTQLRWEHVVSAPAVAAATATETNA